MTRYFSPAKGGFYPEQLHGARRIPAEQSAEEVAAGKRPAMIDNPDTLIPADAVPVDEKAYAKLFDDQAGGKAIAARGGKAVAIETPVDEEELARARKLERNQRLAASDWTQVNDTPLPPETQAEWATYRQELRDLDPAAEEFPEPPALPGRHVP